MEEKKELLKNALTDLVSDLLYYDRKEDEELTIEDVENLINTELISKQELINLFDELLTNNGLE